MAPGSERPPRGQGAQLINLGTMLLRASQWGCVGYFADRWLGTQPWLLLIGLGFGIAGGGRDFYRRSDPEPNDDSGRC